MHMHTKVIVTNWSALKAKYSGSLGAISEAIRALIAADRQRGVRTRFVRLDHHGDMGALGAPPVLDPTDPQENKDAIDAVCDAMSSQDPMSPHYVMLLGSNDVIPHQDLTNPLAAHDGEPHAWSDLPYACKADYGHDIDDFTAPERVVGRLPDLTGGRDASYLLGVLHVAATWRPHPRSDYAPYFALSAKRWEESTTTSLEATFGSAQHMLLSPPHGPHWSDAQIAPRSHFINCHGFAGRSYYHGHADAVGAPALTGALVEGRLTEGTVASVECCFGAELFEPASVDGQMSVCNTYLASGAYAFFGSTNTSYGPDSGNGQADLIARFFLREVLEGASVGHAALEARLRLAGMWADPGPHTRKTLAQFVLLGDPSIHAVQPAHAAKTVPAGAAAKLGAAHLDLLAGRDERRRELRVRAQALAESTRPVVKARSYRLSPPVRRTLKDLARQAGMAMDTLETFRVHPPRGREYRKAAALPAATREALHILSRDDAPEGAPARKPALLIAKEVGGRIVSYTTLRAK